MDVNKVDDKYETQVETNVQSSIEELVIQFQELIAEDIYS